MSAIRFTTTFLALAPLTLIGCAAPTADSAQEDVGESSAAICSTGTAPPANWSGAIGSTLIPDGAFDLTGTQLTATPAYGFNCASDFVAAPATSSIDFGEIASVNVSAYATSEAACNATTLVLDTWVIPRFSLRGQAPTWTLSTQVAHGTFNQFTLFPGGVPTTTCSLGISVPKPTDYLLIGGVELGVRAWDASLKQLPVTLDLFTSEESAIH